MSNYVKLATDAGDQYLTALGEIQDNVLKATTAMTTKMPTSVPTVETPAAFTAMFPTAEEITEASFAFATKFLKQQKSFSEKFVAAFTPPAAK